MASRKLKVLGDFQTPVPLAEKICKLLRGQGCRPDVIIEPTCGSGNFIVAAARTFPPGFQCHAIEIQPEYNAQFDENTRDARQKCDLHHIVADVLRHEFPTREFENRNVLVIGNLPWVTSAGLTALGAGNPVEKRNDQGLKGLDALTGKSNFDIAEAIFERLIHEFSGLDARIALICKSTVARNLIRDGMHRGLRTGHATWYGLDTRREFHVAADAGVLDVITGEPPALTCEARSLDAPGVLSKRFGWVGSHFVSDIKAYAETSRIEGESCHVWRQGIKTDASDVMVFTRACDGSLVNGLGEPANIEDSLVYPFLKGSRLRKPVIYDIQERLLVTQERLGADTSTIELALPRTWDYLVAHGHALDGRKSRIYKDKPRFSIFGVGKYSFKPYKVAVASMYKEPSFSLVCPQDKPVMLDDTSYFLGFDDVHQAMVVQALLSQDVVTRFLNSIVFKHGKRVYTKDVLMRVDLSRALDFVDEGDLARSISSVQRELLDAGVVAKENDPRDAISRAREWFALDARERGVRR